MVPRAPVNVHGRDPPPKVEVPLSALRPPWQ